MSNERNYLFVIPPEKSMGNGPILSCMRSVSKGNTLQVFGDETYAGAIDEIVITCQFVDGSYPLRNPFFKEIRGLLVVTALAIIYEAKIRRQGLSRLFGETGTIASDASIIRPGIDMPFVSPERLIDHVVQEAERLGNKFGKKARVVYFGDHQYVQKYQGQG